MEQVRRRKRGKALAYLEEYESKLQQKLHLKIQKEPHKETAILEQLAGIRRSSKTKLLANDMETDTTDALEDMPSPVLVRNKPQTIESSQIITSRQAVNNDSDPPSSPPNKRVLLSSPPTTKRDLFFMSPPLFGNQASGTMQPETPSQDIPLVPTQPGSLSSPIAPTYFNKPRPVYSSPPPIEPKPAITTIGLGHAPSSEIHLASLPSMARSIVCDHKQGNMLIMLDNGDVQVYREDLVKTMKIDSFGQPISAQFCTDDDAFAVLFATVVCIFRLDDEFTLLCKIPISNQNPPVANVVNVATVALNLSLVGSTEKRPPLQRPSVIDVSRDYDSTNERWLVGINGRGIAVFIISSSYQLLSSGWLCFPTTFECKDITAVATVADQPDIVVVSTSANHVVLWRISLGVVLLDVIVEDDDPWRSPSATALNITPISIITSWMIQPPHLPSRKLNNVVGVPLIVMLLATWRGAALVAIHETKTLVLSIFGNDENEFESFVVSERYVFALVRPSPSTRHRLMVWELFTGKLVARIRVPSSVMCISAHRYQPWLWYGGNDVYMRKLMTVQVTP